MSLALIFNPKSLIPGVTEATHGVQLKMETDKSFLATAEQRFGDASATSSPGLNSDHAL